LPVVLLRMGLFLQPLLIRLGLRSTLFK
jgi:hypothetical protein